MKIEPGVCPYIDETDNCFYLMDYNSRMGYGHSKENQLIFNFKKPKTDNGYQYKLEAIAKIADILITGVFHNIDPSKIIIIPIPPSKTKADPLYDDRMLQVLEIVKKELSIQYVDLLSRPTNIVPLHQNQTPRSLSSHTFNIANDNLSEFDDKQIIIIDDVITTGSTYKAAKNLISQNLNNKIIGLFMARAQ